jgi:segregation and condensation protein B
VERDQQKQIVEALILGATEPVAAARLADVVPGLDAARARALVEELRHEYEREGRAFEIWEVAGGYRIRTRQDFAPYLRQLQKERPLRLSRAALETLSVVAYKQPATRAEIEHVRGVDAGPILRSLLDRKLLRIAGHREVPGRPLLYATTRRFLEVFGLARLEDLPTLREIDRLVAEGVVGESEDENEADDGDGESVSSPEGGAAREGGAELH